jgi:hypothetical protein
MKRGILMVAICGVLLSGCTAAPAATPRPATPSPTSAATTPGCPDIRADQFAVQIETTVADPRAQAESVGLGDVLHGTCAYGFTSDQVAGLAFFVINPTEQDAAVYFGNAVETAAKAGFSMGDTHIQGQNMVQAGSNKDGAEFSVSYYPEVHTGDGGGAFSADRMVTIGLHEGQSIIFGSLQLP